MTLAALRRFFAYNEWANARVFDAAGRVSRDQFTKDLGSSFPSIRDTLAHLAGVEWVWLRRWKGESPSATPGWMAASDVDTLRTHLHEVESERAAFLDALNESDLQRRIAYINFKGERWEYSLADMLLHLVNHSTYHRGQVVTMLRQVGAAAPATDFLVYEDVTT
jgi:uncharacterized damage-inducible protein DinB